MIINKYLLHCILSKTDKSEKNNHVSLEHVFIDYGVINADYQSKVTMQGQERGKATLTKKILLS